MAVSTPQGKSYWWKDKSGKWHYHKQGTAIPDQSLVQTTRDTKPSNIPSNVTPTKPTGGATVNPDAAQATKPGGSKSISTLPRATKPAPTPKPDIGRMPSATTSEQMSRADAKAALAKVGLDPNENAKEVWKSGYQAGSAGKKSAGSGVTTKNHKVSRGSFSSLSGVASGPGRGRAQVDAGQGSRKVYDVAKSRLVKKRKGSRP